jgi:hypothetical protein
VNNWIINDWIYSDYPRISSCLSLGLMNNGNKMFAAELG